MTFTHKLTTRIFIRNATYLYPTCIAFSWLKQSQRYCHQASQICFFIYVSCSLIFSSCCCFLVKAKSMICNSLIQCSITVSGKIICHKTCITYTIMSLRLCQNICGFPSRIIHLVLF